MATNNPWDTDPTSDPAALSGVSPWLTPAAGDAASAPAAAPPAAVTSDAGWGDPASSGAPQTSAAATPASPTAPADVYDAHLTNVAAATTPVAQATAQDGLARQVQSDLEADGHTVKWTDGTTLSVDGRSYELGGAGGQGVTDPAFAANDAFATGVNQLYQQYYHRDATPQEIEGHRGNPAGLPGIETMLKSSQANPANELPTMWPPETTGTGGRMDDTAILAQIALWAKMPGADPTLASDPNYWLNAIKGRGGLGADNQQFWQDASVGDSAFFRHPEREAGGAGGASGAGAGSPWLDANGRPIDPAHPAWSPSTPDYVPGQIDASGSDLPGYQDILDALDTPAAGDAELQKLVQSIVEHPETLSNEDIERLKAQSAEEAAVAGESQDEELKHFGFNTGLDTSPWLAGQRAQNAWNRSNTTITANRGIDIAAADRRQADRQQAASIGQAYSSFQSSKKAQAVGLAVTAALGKAGEQRSRTQLNESLKQAATQLGLTKDNLVMTYLGHVMTDLTNNKQIDLNFDVDMKKLAEQSDEFKQTLLQRLAELNQQDAQFKANYGLDLQKFQHQKDQDAWERAKSTVGA